MSEVSRRDFIKTASLGAGVAVAAGYSPFSYAQNEKIRIGLIGTGGQGTFHIRDGISGAKDLEIVAVCDVFKPNQEWAARYGQLSNAGIAMPAGEQPTRENIQQARDFRMPTTYYDYHEMLDNEELDAVVIATPLNSHFPITMDCLDAGKWVFCEKTLVRNVEEGRKMIEKCHETGKFIQVGHQRRYNPKYNLAMKLAFEEEQIGRINHITAQWHRNHYWRRQIPSDYEMNEQEKKYIVDLERHLNWRMYSDMSGGLYTELATHQTDIANWFMKAVPARVHTFGGIDYWRDGRTVDDNIVLTFEYDMNPRDDGFMPIDARSILQDMRQINQSYQTRFVYTSILANANRGASELLQGDYGTLRLSEQDCWIYGEPDAVASRPADETISAEDYAEGTTSGATLQVSTEELLKGKELLGDLTLETADVYQFRAFAHHIKNGGVPRNNQMVGFTTSLTSIAAIQSREEGRTVEIDPAWYTFDFEVPSFYDYAFEWDDEVQDA